MVSHISPKDDILSSLYKMLTVIRNHPSRLDPAGRMAIRHIVPDFVSGVPEEALLFWFGPECNMGLYTTSRRESLFM